VGGYLGSHLNQVDEKGRVTLPAAFRRESESASFVLIQVYKEALTLYPSDTWEGVERRMQEHLRRAPQRRLEFLALTANAQEVSPDKQGRILIPERLRTRADIQGEALLIGALDKIEIWSPERFENAVGSEPGDLGELLGSLFA
jgi:MraZ protein